MLPAAVDLRREAARARIRQELVDAAVTGGAVVRLETALLLYHRGAPPRLCSLDGATDT